MVIVYDKCVKLIMKNSFVKTLLTVYCIMYTKENIMRGVFYSKNSFATHNYSKKNSVLEVWKCNKTNMNLSGKRILICQKYKNL